jgi:hypothetical protein
MEEGRAVVSILFIGKKLMGYFFGIQEIMHSYHANSSFSKDSQKVSGHS